MGGLRGSSRRQNKYTIRQPVNMQPTHALSDEIYRQKVLRARKMSAEQKLLAGPRLFEWNCEIMKAGIREQFPEADELRVDEILRERLAYRRKMDQWELERTLQERKGED